MYQSKDCVENILEYIEEEVKLLHEIFPRQSMTKLTDVQKREYEAAFASKSLMTPGIERWEITATTSVYIKEQ